MQPRDSLHPAPSRVHPANDAEERSREIVALLADLSRERSVATVMVTHDLSQLDLVDAAFEMHSGALRPRPIATAVN